MSASKRNTMTIHRRTLLAAPALLATPALAQNFPTRPIRVLVPFAPGGFTDILGRFLADRLAGPLGQPLIIENKPGAGGNIAAEQVAKSTPDGHTLLLASIAVFAINAPLYGRLPYDPESLEVVGFVASQPNVLLAGNDTRITSIAELVSRAKAAPESLAYASFGVGSVSHLTMAYMAEALGIKLLHVPYRGSAPALAALMGGEVQLLFDGAGTALPMIRAGRVRALGVTSVARAPDMPEVPAIAETLPGFDMVGWFALAAPGATPAPVLARLRAETEAVLASADFAKLLAERAAVRVPVTPDQAGAFLAGERARWAQAVRQSGAKVE
jgi:tripartite-type tricarboxylate transporter receptor subunit TctC